MSRKTELAKEKRKIRLQNGCCARCGKPNDRIGYYCSECATKHNEYTREARKFYRKIGVCTVCGKNKVFGSERTCIDCRLKQQERREQKSQSDVQRLKDNASRSKGARQRYSERVEDGICTRCGIRKAAPGRKKCRQCLEYDAFIHRKRNFSEPDIREHRVENRLCYHCGQPLTTETGKSCRTCQKKFRDMALQRKHDNPYWQQDNKLIGVKS